MEEDKKKAYSEVVEVLKLIEDEEKIEKIPFEVIQLIKTNADPEYKPEISKDIPLENQGLRDETFSILGWIASKYWGEDIIKNDVQEYEINSVNNAHIENASASVYNDIDPECLKEGKLPALISDMSLFERIKAKIIQIFKILFKINIKNDEKESINETGFTGQ